MQFIRGDFLNTLWPRWPGKTTKENDMAKKLLTGARQGHSRMEQGKQETLQYAHSNPILSSVKKHHSGMLVSEKDHSFAKGNPILSAFVKHDQRSLVYPKS
jgi:hypothetical protein